MLSWKAVKNSKLLAATLGGLAVGAGIFTYNYFTDGIRGDRPKKKKKKKAA